MANVRILGCLLVLLIIINCALTRDFDDSNHRDKRFLFGCAKAGKKCVGGLSKSCCSGYKCNTTTGKCVSKGSSLSWLGDRNGK